jgi:hypothetical protein
MTDTRPTQSPTALATASSSASNVIPIDPSEVLGSNFLTLLTAVGALTLWSAPAELQAAAPQSLTAPRTAGQGVDWKAELRARYAAMPNAAWFRRAHENKSLGEAIRIL